jgi:hypothetical protein
MSVITLSPDEKDLYKIVFAIRQLQEGRSNRPACKVGTLTRDMSLASGNQPVTGVGFKPAAVIFFAGVQAGTGDSKGIDDGTTSGYAADDYADVAGGQAVGTGVSIVIVPAAGKAYSGKIASIDADGFTIAWTRTSTPTGTINVTYLAIPAN